MSDPEFIAAYKTEGPAALSHRLKLNTSTLSTHAKRLRIRGYTVDTPTIAPRKTNTILTTINDDQIKKDVEILGILAAAKTYGVNSGTLSGRIRKIRENGGEIISPNNTGPNTIRTDVIRMHPQRYELDVENGTVIIFSDAHYWPGKASVAHRALVKMIHEKTPAAVICNGDAVDMAAASRHPPIGWEKRPSVQEEIETAQERLGEILAACTKRTRKSWNLGNHDARFETRLAAVAPEYAKVAGIHLHDHFPEWERAWSTWINNSVVVKHRYKGGTHAPHNNTATAGKTVVTGHLHSAKVTPFTDYNGTRFGVDTGCLADTFGPQFTNYMEDNPRNWISAFGILTFRKGQLLWPELVVAWDAQHVQYRGELIRV